MLAVSVVLFTLLVVALFARSWEFGGHGPGIMTKIKIFLTDFQVLCTARKRGKKVEKKAGAWRAVSSGSTGEATACCCLCLLACMLQAAG